MMQVEGPSIETAAAEETEEDEESEVEDGYMDP